MKNVIIIVALILVSINSFAQKFTINELVKMLKFNDDQFDTYITKKGFQYWKTETFSPSGELPYTATLYAHNKNGHSDKSGYFISKCISAGVVFINLQTSQKTDYLSFKSDISASGFKYDGTKDNENGAKYLYYSKGTLAICLISTEGTNGLQEKITLYKLTIQYQ